MNASGFVCKKFVSQKSHKTNEQVHLAMHVAIAIGLISLNYSYNLSL